MSTLSAGDLELLDRARDIIGRMYEPKRHRLSAALRTRSGNIYLGLHLGTAAGNCAVCAEAVALGLALSAGDRELDTIVTVQYTGHSQLCAVVSPCGRCRELLKEYGDVMVICPKDGRLKKVSIRFLLPDPYADPMSASSSALFQ